MIAQKKNLGGVEGSGDFDCEEIGVDAQGVAVGTEANGLDDRDDAFGDEVPEEEAPADVQSTGGFDALDALRGALDAK